LVQACKRRNERSCVCSGVGDLSAVQRADEIVARIASAACVACVAEQLWLWAETVMVSDGW